MGERTHAIGDPTEEPGTLPAATRVGRVRLRVSDLERSVAFYRGVVGLHLARSEDDVAALSDAAGGTELVELHERPGIAPAGRTAPGLFHVALLVPSRGALGRVLSRFAETGWGPLGASDHGVSEALYTADPDGNGVEVYADRARSAWRSRGGELVMTTEPLDVADLRRAAAPPADAPTPGTAVGHVHFHVTDLAAADAFYRDALGMALTVGSYPGARFYAAGGYHHHVAANVWGGAGGGRTGEGRAGLVDWELVVPTGEDVARVAGRLDGAGFPTSAVDGGREVADPSGARMRIATAPRSF